MISRNQFGVSQSGFFSPAIQSNRVFQNREDGILVGTGGDSLLVISDNEIQRNGGNGISLQSGGLHGSQIEDNLVRANRGYGIGLQFGNNVLVKGNRMSGNGVDLYWDGSGTNNCSEQNIFNTASPNVLPPC